QSLSPRPVRGAVRRAARATVPSASEFGDPGGRNHLDPGFMVEAAMATECWSRARLRVVSARTLRRPRAEPYPTLHPFLLRPSGCAGGHPLALLAGAQQWLEER